MRILVVDDDPLAGELTSAILEGAGHVPVAVGSGAEALERLDAEPSISLIVCDMNMPLASGLDLFAELRDRGIALPFILLSGDDPEGLRKLAPGIDAFLAKDYSLETELPRAVDGLPATRRGG